MKKKFFMVLAVLTCILGLAACGKKSEEPTEETHNYAVNPVQEKTDTITEETGDIQTLTESDPWNRQESNDKASEVMTSDNVSEYDEEKKKLLDESIKLFRDARVKTFRTIGKSYILIVYEYHNKTNIIIYNKETGDIDNG